MVLSKWSISHKGKLSHAGSRQYTTPLRILLLDDHKFFRQAITAYCILPFSENINLIEFENGDEAYAFIKKGIDDKRRIDLIITGINHPGLKGQELVKSIRYYEGMRGNKKRIPIIILTMIDKTRYSELIADKMVDFYLTKATEPEDIINCIEEILYI